MAEESGLGVPTGKNASSLGCAFVHSHFFLPPHKELPSHVFPSDSVRTVPELGPYHIAGGAGQGR
jgi:hypothetical protein